MSTDNAILALTNKQLLWLAGIAACAGLALAGRWWLSRRILRNRALQVLGFSNPGGLAIGQRVRYAGIIAAAIVTIFALTPTTPGAGDTEPAVEVVTSAAIESTLEVIVVEVRSDSATILVQGGVIEIRIAPDAPTPPADAIHTSPNGGFSAPTPTAKPAASALPEGMD